MFSHLAHGMNAHGVTVAVSGYDLVPQVSIADIMAQTQAACLFLWKKFGRRIMVSGHSAGGHLAACMLATDWTKLDAGAPADLVPAAYAISGLYDLAPLLHLSGNAEFKLTEAGAKAISPLFWPAPKGKVLDAVVGGIEFVRISATKQDHRGCMGEGQQDPLRGGARDESLHHLRCDGRSGERDDESAG